MSFENGAVKAIRIAPDGWSAKVTLQGMGRADAPVIYRLDGQLVPGIQFDVTNPDGSIRQIVATQVVRRPYPEEDELDHEIVGNDLVVRVALSEFVFSTSQIIANAQPGWAVVEAGGPVMTSAATAGIAVENASAILATDATAIANFVTPDRQLVAEFIHVEVIAGSIFAEAGAEIAAVRFVASDQHGNAVQVEVTQSTLSTWGVGDARPVLSFGADIATAGLTDGDLITVRAEIIDHLGQVSASAPYGSTPANPAAFVDQVYRLDVDGSFGKSFAYVDVNAPSTAGIVSDDPTVAAASPFNTIAAAMKAAQVFNQQNFGRTNLDNSEIRLKAGTHVWVNGTLSTSTAKTDDVWMTITRDPAATREDVRLTGATDGKNNFGFADNIKIQGLTIDRGPMGSALAPIMRGQADDALWLHDVAFDGRDQRAASFRLPDIWVTQSDFTRTSRTLTTFGSELNVFRIRGIEATATPDNIINGHLVVGSDLHNLGVRFPATSRMPGASGSVIAYNEISVSNSTNLVTVSGLSGIAIIGNVFDAVSGDSSAIRISGDGAVSEISNVVFHHNTVLNERMNVGYNDIAGQNWTKELFSLKWNDLYQLNTKHDVFSADSKNTGAWSVLYGVAFESNVIHNEPAGSAASFGFAFNGLAASGDGLSQPSDQRDTPDALPVSAQIVGLNDVFTVAEDTVLNVVAAQGVLSNDSVQNGQSAVATLVEGPRHGTLTFAPDGGFSYVPLPNFNGADSFRYIVTANGLTSSPVEAIIEVRAVNDAPVSNSPAAAIITENIAAVATISAVDVDTGSSLFYSLAGGADATLFTINSATGALAFRSAPDFEVPADVGGNNIYDVVVRASDGQLSADRSFSVTVIGVNEAPSAQADAIALDRNATTANLWETLLANDTDSDIGDTRRIVSVDAVGTIGAISFDAVNQIVTYSATAAAFTALGAGQTALDLFRYTIRDTDGLTAAATVTVTVHGIVNVINGTTGADTLTGSLGGRDLHGLAGNDTYLVLSAADRVFEAAGKTAGVDAIQTALARYTLPDNVENLIYTGTTAAFLAGNALVNTITSGDADDYLDGGAAGDRLIGGLGNDTYVVDKAGSSGDVLIDAGGTDLVKAWLSWTLADGFENLELLGGTSAYGNAGNNILIGNAGNNLLDGRGGVDTMLGMAGDDTYIIDNPGDLAIEILDNADSGGIDLVRSTLDWTLAAGIENLSLIGAAGATMAGTGNGLANQITGGAGADRLLGLGGDDMIIGGTGEDTLDGGSGADRLTGGQNNDVFILAKGEADGDVITDFVGKGNAVGDRIHLAGWGAGTTFLNIAPSVWRITDGVDGTIASVTVFGGVVPSDIFIG